MEKTLSALKKIYRLTPSKDIQEWWEYNKRKCVEGLTAGSKFRGYDNWEYVLDRNAESLTAG